MRLRVRLFCLPVIIICFFVAEFLRAQDDNPLNDPDLNALLKQAQEMQKSSGSSDARKKLGEMEAMAKQEAPQQEQ